MVNSVSTYGQFNYIQDIVQGTQSQLDNLQDQISSGHKATTYAGLGAAPTLQSLSLNSQLNQLTTINDGINSVNTITSTTDAQLTNITTTATNVLSALQSKVQSGDPGMALLSQQAQQALASVQNSLNTQSGSTYIFAGSNSNTAPVASTTAINTAAQADIAAFQAGTETPATVLSNVTGYTAAQVGYSSTLAAAKQVSVPISPSSSVGYSVKADNAGFQDLQKGLSIIANLTYNSSDQAGFYKIYNGAIALINQGNTEVTADQASLGITTKQLSDTQTQIAAQQTVLNNAVVNVQDLSSTDLAKASTTLTNLQTQLQTSYTIIGSLKNDSLVNYLNGSI